MDRSQCLLSSEFIYFYFGPTVGEWQPLRLATAGWKFRLAQVVHT